MKIRGVIGRLGDSGWVCDDLGGKILHRDWLHCDTSFLGWVIDRCRFDVINCKIPL